MHNYSPLALNSYTHLIHTTLDFPCYYFHSLNSYTHLIHTPPSDNSYVYSGAAGDFWGVQSGQIIQNLKFSPAAQSSRTRI